MEPYQRAAGQIVQFGHLVDIAGQVALAAALQTAIALIAPK